MYKKNGESLPVYVTCTTLKDMQGDVDGFIVVAHDQTEEIATKKKIDKLRRERIIAINEVQENERMRFATDLHDGIGQMLTSLSYSLQKLSIEKKIDPDYAEKLQQQINSAIQEAKTIAHNLTPILLKDFGLIVAIKDLVNRNNQINGTEVVFNSYNFIRKIDKNKEINLYRICQEALNNFVKYAGTTKGSVEIFQTEDQIVMVVADEGVGFEDRNSSHQDNFTGIGLISIRERVNAFNGFFTINSQLGKGTELIIEIPI